MSGQVTPFITGLPTGDHPTEQLAFNANWIYWTQGSTTNSGVVGRDNGGGANQPDIPCQDIVLSNNVFDSGGGVKTSGYSPFGVQRPGATVKAFEGATARGMCDGSVLRARLNSVKSGRHDRAVFMGLPQRLCPSFRAQQSPVEWRAACGRRRRRRARGAAFAKCT